MLTLQVLQPHAAHLDLEQTKRAVREFSKPNGLGELLQEQLVRKSECEENWLTPWWEQVNDF